MIKFTAQIEPIPLARPRVNTQTRQAFYPKRSADFKKALSLIAKAAMRGQKPLTGKLVVRLKLYRKFMPTSQMFGDVDNHQKAIFDALNGICFEDDKQICKVVCEKIQDKKNPRIEIEIDDSCDGYFSENPDKVVLRGTPHCNEETIRIGGKEGKYFIERLSVICPAPYHEKSGRLYFKTLPEARKALAESAENRRMNFYLADGLENGSKIAVKKGDRYVAIDKSEQGD